MRESIRYVQSLGVTPTICPMRIAPNTVVADLAAKGLYDPPDLWDLYHALQGLTNVRVAASLLPDYGGPVRLAFDALNKTGMLPTLPPSCPHPEPIEPKREVVLAKIERYLKLCPSALQNPGGL